jgi:hypothetical protein
MAAVLPSTLQGVQEAADSAQVRPPFIHPAGIWLRGGYGSFDANPDPQLPGQRGHGTFIFGIGAELGVAPMLALEFEVISTTRTYDTEGGAFIIVVDDETSVTSSAFTLGTRVILPPASPVRVYLAGGLAYIHTAFKTDASLFGIPGVAKEQTDGAVRPVYGAGAQVILGDWEVHVDWRKFGLTGSFPTYEVDAVDLGGSVVSFGIGWRGAFRPNGTPRADSEERDGGARLAASGPKVGPTARASRRHSPL